MLIRKIVSSFIEIYASGCGLLGCYTVQTCIRIPNQKVHYCVHKSQPPDPVKIWINQSDTLRYCLFKVIFSIRGFTSRTSKVVSSHQSFQPKLCMHLSAPPPRYLRHSCFNTTQRPTRIQQKVPSFVVYAFVLLTYPVFFVEVDV